MSRRTWVGLLLLSSGCDKLFSGVHPDAPALCFGSGATGSLPLSICPEDVRTVPPRLDIKTDTTIDTDSPMFCASYTGNDLRPCVVIAQAIVIDATLRGIGSRPLVLLATTDLTIAGTVDVSSTKDAKARAPAMTPAGCQPSRPATPEGVAAVSKDEAETAELAARAAAAVECRSKLSRRSIGCAEDATVEAAPVLARHEASVVVPSI